LWSVREARFVDERALVDALHAARLRFIGEVHDHAGQHELRARLVASLADQRPAAVMEIFDIGHDAALARAQASGGDADAIATAGGLDRAAWRWPLHRPLVEAALAARLPIRAANVARAELMALARSGDGARWQERIAATRWGEHEQRAMHDTIVDAHCGALPADAVPAIAFAQRIRDAAMADALAAAARDAGGAVLLAGNGHVRRDIGAPRYVAAAELPRGDADMIAVAFEEADAGEMRSAAFARRYVAEHPGYDYVWFTLPAARPDPCEAFKSGSRRGS
jgi:uncharacterized iron-regulated protein